MNKLILVISAVLLTYLASMAALPSFESANTLTVPAIRSYSKLSVNELENLAGRKLTFKEKLTWILFKNQLIKLEQVLLLTSFF